MDKFEHGFGTQLGAVLLWQRVRSVGLMLAAWSYQTTAAGNKKQKKIRHAIRCCFAVAKGSFWRADACSLELPDNSCRKQKNKKR